MPDNGKINQKSRTYESVCCGAKIALNSGAPFPDCPKHPKLPTIWKPVVGDKIISQTTNGSQSDPRHEAHIENRRLFGLAAGMFRLEDWEQEHVHECKVCQGILCVLMNQPNGALTENPPKSRSTKAA